MNNQALHFVAHLTSYQSSLEILLEEGADVNSRNDKGETPLLVAVSFTTNRSVLSMRKL